MTQYLSMWKRAFDFNGVSTRSEFWLAFLFNAIIGVVIGIISLVSPTVSYLLSGLYGIATLIPGLSLSVRRLHDTNKSGLFLLMSFIPLVGGIILLVFFCSDSVRANNKYAIA